MSNPLLTDIQVGDTPGIRWAKLNAWMSYLATNISTGTGLPSQGGNNGKFLTTDGTTASWATLAGGGNVSNTGTPTAGQVAEWTNATTVQGVAVTGTGSYVKATSPTLVTPILGTPTSITLTNATGLPISTGVSGLGANVATFLASSTSANLLAAVTDETGSGALVFATSPTLVTPLLGTPTSGVLTNCTGYTIANLSGAAAGVLTFLATPSSANLIAAITDETGSGALVFATSPTLVTPILGTPTSGTLTNCTLPVGGVTGLGTGVATFLATPSSANLLAAITDETGSGVAVFGTSPSFTTSILTGSATFALLNTTATTVNAFGAATTLNIGASATCILNFGGGTTASEFRFLEPSGSGTNYTAIKAVAQGANITYSLPATVGAAGTFLRDAAGNGVLDWATPGGSGTVTVVGAGSLTSTALTTGGGTTTIQTPSATTTLDSSGNISTPGSISTGVGSGLAGFIEFTQGSAPSAGTTSIKLYAPASVTSYIRNLPAVAGTGFYLGTNSSGVVTDTQVGFTGTNNVVRDTTPTINTPVFAGGNTASGSGANTWAASTGTFITSTGANTLSGAVTLNSTLTLGGTALTFGALPSGATTTGTLATFAAQTYTVTGTNTATAFQGIYHGIVTVTDASAGTVTDLFSENWAGPAAGAGSLVVTRAHTLGILDSTSASSSITGGLIVAAVYGTTATSVGIGGGNVNAGGNGTFGGTLAVTGHVTFEGVTSTGATGTNLLVFATSPTITTPVIASGLTASGSGANTWVGSSGTFITSTGANTLSGAVTVNDATTPSITLASGKTNTGFLLINGKTSGGLKLIAADAAAQTVTVSLAAQTTGASTLTLPDMAGVSDTFAFLAKAQTFTGVQTFSSATNNSSGVVITPAAYTSGANAHVAYTSGADTGLTASTEARGWSWATATRTWATTGTVANQREYHFAGVTYASASPSQTFTDVSTLSVTQPIAGTNAIFTRAHSLQIVDSTSAASSITGGFVIATTLGTTATSVGIGGGNVNAGGNGTFGGTLAVTGHLTFEGVTSTGATGTNLLVFATSPTLTTPVLGVATATSINKWAFTAPTTACTLTSGADNLTYTLPDITCNIGFREIPQNSKSAAYTTVLADSGKHLYHPSADTTARTFTIDSNANVAYPIGTAITFINDISGGVITIAITTDTMVLFPGGSTGSRTLAAGNTATAVKVTSTRWIITGTSGLT